MNTDSLSDSQREILITQIQNSEAKLQQSSQTVTSHAFNLAVSVAIIPAGVILLIVFLISHGNLPTLFVATILVVIAVAIFASLVAYQSRARSLQRIFDQEIMPEIMSNLHETNLTLGQYHSLAQEELPEGSFIIDFLARQSSTEVENSNTEQ